MRIVVLGALYLSVLAFSPQSSMAQAASQAEAAVSDTVRVHLLDGTSHVGVVVSENDEELVFRTLGGVRLTIPRAQIRSLAPVMIRGGKEYSEDPNQTRLFFAPTARPLGSGNGYVAVYEIFFPFVAVGVGEAVTLAGGVSLIPGLSGQMVYVAPKVTLLRQGKGSLAAGVFANTVVGNWDDDVPIFGLLFAVGTYGDSHAAVTAGIGFGFADGELAEHPAIVLGGEYQIGRRTKALTENYLVPGIDGALLLSVGLRNFGDRLAVDYGLATPPSAWNDGGFPFFPWLGFAYNW